MTGTWLFWLRWAPVAALGLALTACGDSNDDPAVDAGGDGDTGGGDGDGDSVWMPRDTGPRGGDAGQTNYPDQCDVLLGLRAEEDLPLCTAETRQCIERCDPTAMGCSDACLAGNPPPGAGQVLDCEGCVFTGLFKCFADNGCATEINDFMCCFEANCFGGADSCVDAKCADELSAAINCGVTGAPQCLDPLSGSADCFPDADADAGM